MLEDSGLPVRGTDAPCGACGEVIPWDGPDPCLGWLPGVRNACCGHTEKDCAYIQLPDGECVRGFTAVQVRLWSMR